MTDSRLSRIATVAEIVSALAVVATVIYAVGELNQSRARGNTDVETVLYARILEMDRLLVEVDGLADMVMRASEDPASLTPLERRRYLAYEHIYYDTWEVAVKARQNGLMAGSTFNGWNAWFAEDAARRPRFGWTENHRYYDSAFIDYVEKLVDWE
jgi:hypothetical protein